MNDKERNDILEIGSGDGIVKGLNYKLARCCNPIYGDHVFGFISSEGVVKIHRKDCPNAKSAQDPTQKAFSSKRKQR